MCNNAKFGDPLRGVVKACFCEKNTTEIDLEAVVLNPIENVGYDEDPRVLITPYKITKEFNFIVGAEYNQIVLATSDQELSYTDAMNIAVKEAK